MFKATVSFRSPDGSITLREHDCAPKAKTWRQAFQEILDTYNTEGLHMTALKIVEGEEGDR